jgi:hypothetical protein
MPLPKVIQLRQSLADKFPGARLHLREKPARAAARPPAVSPLLDLFQNELLKGALNEIVAAQTACGSATLTRALMEWAAGKNQIMALVDGSDSFDATALDAPALGRLLWVRCSEAEKALKAMDLLLRDSNVSLIVLDLKLNPENQLRKIPATNWHRLQRLAENANAVCVTLTPRPLVAAAQTRVVLQSDFSLDDLQRDAAELLRELQWELAGSRHSYKTALHSA